MQTNFEQPKEQVKYYGKKAYRVNPMLVRLKVPEQSQPKFWTENIRERQTQQRSAQASK